MSSLLPILFDFQNGTTAISGTASGNEPLGQVSKDQQTPPGLPLPPPFSQIFREQKDLRSLEALGKHDTVERTLSESRSSRPEKSPEIVVQPISGADVLPDPSSPLSTQFLDGTFTTLHNTAPERSQIFSPKPLTSPVGVPSAALTAIEKFQTSVPARFQGNVGQPTEGNSLLGQVRQDTVNISDTLGQVQIPRPQVFESGVTSQQVSLSKSPESGFVPESVSQGLAEKHTSVILNREGESTTRTVVPPAKDVLSNLEQVEGSSQRNQAPSVSRLQSSLSHALAQSPTVLSNHTPHTTALQADGTVGLTDREPVSQPSIKPALGTPSVSNEVSGSVSEHRTPVPIDLHGESALLSKGDRPHNLVETSIRGVGTEASGGHGLGMGMNHSSNSQSGYQQSPFSSGEGVGLRALEERRPDLPAPALQRLQMDVQLSENNRVHVDVGVQSRQVYAGLVMDHSVLRNLATQFVPQLENQMSQVDLDLQEFSAEVRDEHQQHADTMFHDPRSRGHQDADGHSQSESNPTVNLLNRFQDQGLHLVA